ncbi:MAG: DUF6488 family protein [Campylobacterota bacterium]
MKLFKITIFMLLLTFLSAGLFAHGGAHTHKSSEVPEVKVKEIAIAYVNKLVSEGKIERSWLKSSIINSEKKIFNKNVEWVISFGNDYLKDVEKQILYIFVDMDAEVTGANYTGN